MKQPKPAMSDPNPQPAETPAAGKPISEMNGDELAQRTIVAAVILHGLLASGNAQFADPRIASEHAAQHADALLARLMR